MKYIVMADGKESRWKNFQGIHKWQIRIGNQTLLERTCGLIRELDPDAAIYITSHDQNLSIAGTVRHEPMHNVLEIDRFTVELIEPNVCFLYGDSLYSEESLRRIMEEETKGVLFFGSPRKIFAVKVADAQLFRQHLQHVRELFLREEIHECIGWEVYHSLYSLPLESREIGAGYILLDNETRDFNSPEDLIAYREEKGIHN